MGFSLVRVPDFLREDCKKKNKQELYERSYNGYNLKLSTLSSGAIGIQNKWNYLFISIAMQEEGGDWKCEPWRSDQPSLPASFAPVRHHSKLDLYKNHICPSHKTRLASNKCSLLRLTNTAGQTRSIFLWTLAQKKSRPLSLFANCRVKDWKLTNWWGNSFILSIFIYYIFILSFNERLDKKLSWTPFIVHN